MIRYVCFQYYVHLSTKDTIKIWLSDFLSAIRKDCCFTAGALSVTRSKVWLKTIRTEKPGWENTKPVSGCPHGAVTATEPRLAPRLADVRNSVATRDKSSFNVQSHLQEKTDTRNH